MGGVLGRMGEVNSVGREWMEEAGEREGEDQGEFGEGDGESDESGELVCGGLMEVV
jgi:hypothetical protein